MPPRVEDRACPAEDVLASYAGGGLAEGRAAPIRDHLDECDACGSAVLALIRGSREGGQPARPLLDDVSPAPGTRIGRFTLARALGNGAMGWVFVAQDPELEREVAIKILRDPAGEASQIGRLLREAKAMARLRHRNVITIYEAGRDRDLGFIAMELIRGPTLRAAIAAQRPAVAIVIDWLVQAGRGLAAIHAAGLLHRDLKPDNLFAEPDGADGHRIVVGDLGLAASVHAGAQPLDAGAPAAAQISRAAGTPAYMAPETIEGAPIDQRSDVFAFGVTAWELLTGQRPYAGRTLAELRAAIRQGTRWPPGAPRLSPTTLRVLERCVAAEPAARPGSMAEVVAALELAARPPSRRAWSRVARLAGAVVVAALAVVAIDRTRRGGGTAGAESPCDPAALSPWSVGRATWLARAGALTPHARAGLAAVMDRRAEGWPRAAATACARPALVQQTWRACRERLERREAAVLELAVERPWRDDTGLPRVLERLDPPSSCGSAQAAAEVLAAARLPDDAARRALETGAIGLVRAEAMRLLDPDAIGAELARVRSIATTITPSPLDAALALAEAELTPPASTVARIEALQAAAGLAESRGESAVAAGAWLAQLGQSADLRLDARAVEQALRQADWAIERLDNPPRLRARWEMRAAGAAWARGDHARSRGHMRASAALIADDPWVAADHSASLAQLAAASGDDHAAAAIYEELVADPALMTSLGALARMQLHAYYSECLYRLGRLAEALAQSTAARAQAETALAPGDPESITLVMSEAMIRLDQGDVALAGRMMTTACQQLITAMGADHRRIGECRLRQAYVLMVEGRTADALVPARDAVRIVDLHHADKTQEGLMARALLIDLLALAGPMTDASVAMYAQIVTDAEAAFGTAHPSWAQHATGYAIVLRGRGRDDEAAALLERVIPALEAARADRGLLAQSQYHLALALRRRDPPRARLLASAAESAWRSLPGSEAEHRSAAQLVRQLAPK